MFVKKLSAHCNSERGVLLDRMCMHASLIRGKLCDFRYRSRSETYSNGQGSLSSQFPSNRFISQFPVVVAQLYVIVHSFMTVAWFFTTSLSVTFWCLGLKETFLWLHCLHSSTSKTTVCFGMQLTVAYIPMLWREKHISYHHSPVPVKHS